MLLLLVIFSPIESIFKRYLHFTLEIKMSTSQSTKFKLLRSTFMHGSQSEQIIYFDQKGIGFQY